MVIGDRAYLLGRDLAALDISDPTSPELLGELDFPGSIKDLEVDGTIGFAATDFSGFRVLDLAPPYFTRCEIGLYRNIGGLKKFFFVTNEDRITDFSHVFGPMESDVFVGKWDGTRDNNAIRRAIGGVSKYFINTDDDAAAEDAFVFGPATAVDTSETIIADWDGDGTDNIGFRKNIGGVAKFFLAGGWPRAIRLVTVRQLFGFCPIFV